MKKAIIFDLDGTYVDDRAALIENNVDIIRQIRKRGHLVSIATGRMKMGSTKIALETDADVHLVCCNGALVYENIGGEFVLLQETKFSLEALKIAIGLIHKYNAYFHMYDEELIHTNRPEAFAREYYKRYRSFGFDIVRCYDDIDSIITEDFRVHKLGICNDGMYDYEALKKELAACELLDIRSSTDDFLDIGMANVNKWAGAKALLAKYGIDEKNTMFFGDHENDFEGIENAGIGVAMKNAIVEAKEKADKITEFTNDDEGLYRFLISNPEFFGLV